MIKFEVELAEDVSERSLFVEESPSKNEPKPPIELVEHKEKQKALRTETKYFEE